MLRGERVWLRAYEEEDLEPYAGFTQSAAGTRAGYTVPRGRRGVEQWWKKVQEEHGRSAYYFVISPLGSRDFVGTVWLWNLDQRIGGAEFSIFIADPAKWGSGLGSDATRVLLDYAFGFTDVNRIWLFTESDNVRAQRSFEKCGFVKEGVLRKHMRIKGELIDSVLMAILRSEWDQLEHKRSWEYAGD